MSMCRGSKFLIACNSGGIECEAFNVIEKGNQKDIRLGDIVNVAMKKTIASTDVSLKVKSGEVYKAIVVATKASAKNFDGGYSSCGSNRVVLLNADFSMIGTFVNGPVFRSAFLNHKHRSNILKILSVSEEVC